MVAHTSLSAHACLAWLSMMEYPTPKPGGAGVLLELEGARAQLQQNGAGRLWSSPAPGDLGDVWEGIGDAPVAAWSVENAQDEFNELSALLWYDGEDLHLGAFRGSADPGSVLSRRTGWPHLGDGAHHYHRSYFYKRLSDGTVVFDKDRPALRSRANRCVRETPPQPGVGGDGKVTLSEVIARGMGHNGAILIHPGRRPTSSAGCGLTSGGYHDVAWRSVWGHTHPEHGIWVVQHLGADMLGWVATGGPRGHIPVLRPGANSQRWMVPIQRALGVTPDGVFGPKTARALLTFRLTKLRWEYDRANVGAITAEDWHHLGLLA